jgi:hypothetical protein
MVVQMNKNDRRQSVLELTGGEVLKYFAKEAKDIAKAVNGAKERVQEVTILAMAHAEKHGDWTSTLLPIMEVMLTSGSGKEATHGPFGQAMGLAYAAYITKYTKLVYNPKGFNGRKLAKLPIHERWQWDKTKLFDVEAAERTKWWTLATQRNNRDEPDFLDETVYDARINRFIVAITKVFNETPGMTEETFDAYKAKLVDRVSKIKFAPVGTQVANSVDGRTGPENPERVVDEQEHETKAA